MKNLQFEGNGFEYFKIWIVNILLTIITLGLFYPWAKVRNRRYFYGNTTLEGRNFDYHATGKQLFFGYLIAMGLLIAFVVVQQISPIGSGILTIILFFGFPWVIWRSLVFNLRMTSFSNVRFGFEGTLSGAYYSFMLLPIVLAIAVYGSLAVLVIVVSLLATTADTGIVAIITMVGIVAVTAIGIYLYAFMMCVNKNYTIGGYRYGQGQFTTDFHTREFSMILLRTIGLSILVMLALTIGFAILAAITAGIEGLANLGETMNNPEALAQGMGATLVVLMILFYLGMILAFFVISAYMATRQRSYIFANSTLDSKITFASTLQARTLASVMITNLLLTIFTLGLATPWAKVRMARVLLENSQVNADEGFDQYINEKIEQQSSLGEQIGDAFDINVDIGL